MSLLQGRMEFEEASSAWLRFCIGAAVLMLSAAPLVYVARWW